MAAFAAVVGIIFVSSAILYDRLRVIELAKNARIHTTDILKTLQDFPLAEREAGLTSAISTERTNSRVCPNASTDPKGTFEGAARRPLPPQRIN